MKHRMDFEDGTDARNYIGRCSCGYEISGTYLQVRNRAALHLHYFVSEPYAWYDSRRTTMMPPTYMEFNPKWRTPIASTDSI